MAISRYPASDYKPKWVGFVYALRSPDDGYIFYVGKTTDIKGRLIGHVCSGRVENPTKKGRIIKDILKDGKKPFITVIERFEIRTQYDNHYYDYKEYYWIKKYLEYGWELTNIRMNDLIQSEGRYKRIIENATKGGTLEPSDFYFGVDEKGFPIYDHSKILELGYSFSKSQFASHWAYVIDLERYENVPETTMDYVYSDIWIEGKTKMNENFFDY